MRYILMITMMLMFAGCATWSGIKQDTKAGANWTKEKVHDGASYVEQKTE